MRRGLMVPVSSTLNGIDYVQAISTISGLAVFFRARAELRWGVNPNLYFASAS